MQMNNGKFVGTWVHNMNTTEKDEFVIAIYEDGTAKYTYTKILFGEAIQSLDASWQLIDGNKNILRPELENNTVKHFQYNEENDTLVKVYYDDGDVEYTSERYSRK